MINVSVLLLSESPLAKDLSSFESSNNYSKDPRILVVVVVGNGFTQLY
jgi:hypothetical protein